MKILTAAQIRDLDAHTIEQEPIASIDLMERAAQTFTHWFITEFTDVEQPVYIFCGIGNNGGDGLAIGRQLSNLFYPVHIFHCHISDSTSEDFDKNLDRLKEDNFSNYFEIHQGDAFPDLPDAGIIIDALFGSGLNRSVEGYWADLLQFLNQSRLTKVSVDLPSGMFADRVTEGVSILADYTFSFELPKLAFLFPENQERIGEWQVEGIGLNQDFIKNSATPYYIVTSNLAAEFLKKRKAFDHKGTFGHALMVCGSYGKVGAAVLAARACLRTGAGMVTIHAPKSAYEILQISFPEAMVEVDPHQYCITEVKGLGKYKAIGIGCGIGTNALTASALLSLLKQSNQPLVLDADALNLLSKQPDWLWHLPKNSILTPHPKEFERLFGKTKNDFERHTLQRDVAQELGAFIVLKGGITTIACPDGRYFFNTNGNPGMGTAGMGDVLTGMLTGLLSQGYSEEKAVILGVFLHGLAGDIAAEALQQESLLAGDLIQYIGKAYQALRR